VLEAFTAETFARHLGEAFRVVPDSAVPIAMELVEATELGGETARPGEAPTKRVPFSIVFRGPGGVVLPQRIYRVEHDAIGAFDLFLVPIGPDGAGMRYEAIFT
jgi:hypothetical protein